jgi:hypothetical protein
MSNSNGLSSAILIDEYTFVELRQELKLYRRDNILILIIHDMDFGANQPIRNVTKFDYNRLVRIYKKLNKLVGEQHEKPMK